MTQLRANVHSARTKGRLEKRLTGIAEWLRAALRRHLRITLASRLNNN